MNLILKYMLDTSLFSINPEPFNFGDMQRKRVNIENKSLATDMEVLANDWKNVFADMKNSFNNLNSEQYTSSNTP